ncbi:MAG: PKD domain-containing protein [Saprospiraceae bacterium]|nr:PKD domain-containing protein [Saprospiraceae bacterium]
MKKYFYNLTLIYNVFLCSLFLMTTYYFGVAQNIRYEENYGSQGNDYLRNFFQTADQGYIAIGYSESVSGQVDPLNCAGYTPNDGWIVKLTSSDGQISWKKTVGGGENDYVYDGIETSGGFVFSGTTYSDDCDLVNESPGGWVFKLDQSGDLSWSYSYTPTSDPSKVFKMSSIVEKTAVSGFLLGGNYNLGPTNNAWLMDVNDFGIKGSFEELLTDRFIVDIKNSPDGGYVVGGFSYEYCPMCECANGTENLEITNVWFRKYDGQFNLIWDQEYGLINYFDYLSDFVVNSDNSISAVGLSTQCYIYENQISGNGRSMLVGLPDGNWGMNIGSGGQLLNSIELDFSVGTYLDAKDNQYGSRMATTSEGGFVFCTQIPEEIAACLDPSQNLGRQYWMIKTGSQFEIEWFKDFGGSDQDFAFSIEQIVDGGYILGGISLSNDYDVGGNYGNYDYWIVEIDSFQNGPYCPVNPYTYYTDPQISLLTHSNRIRRVVMGMIDHESTDGDPGYSNFTDISTIIEPSTNVEMSLYNLNEFVSAGVSYHGANYGVWIDWNQDGDFYDPGEETIFSVYYDQNDFYASVTTHTFAIPPITNLPSEYTMRIGIFPDGINPDPCIPCFFGEYEDYTLQVDLIPNLNCSYTGYTLNSNYQHAPYDYVDYMSVGSSVLYYPQCNNEQYPGHEECWDLFPMEFDQQITIEVEMFGVDVDVFVIKNYNEKTGLVACSTESGFTDEILTFSNDPNVDQYTVVIDSKTPSNGSGYYYIRVTSQPLFRCDDDYFTTNEQFDVTSLMMGCDDLKSTNRIVVNPAAPVNYNLTLADNSSNQNGVPPVESYLRIWLDLNGDGDYSDMGEMIEDEVWQNNYTHSSSVSLTNVVPGTYKMRYQVACFKDDINFPANPCIFWFNGAEVRDLEIKIIDDQDPYCFSKGCVTCPNGGETYINQVAFYQSVVPSFNDGGYGCFLDYPEIIPQNGNLQMVIDGYSCGGENLFYSAFIDVTGPNGPGNPNGSFSDFGEVQSGTSNLIIFNLTGVPPGEYRLRIMAESYTGALPSANPCKVDFKGETEDYTFIICPSGQNCVAKPLVGISSTQNYGIAPLVVDFAPDFGELTINSLFIDTTSYTYSWIFQGGQPTSSTEKYPTIVYNSPGKYDVSLEITNTAGTSTLTKNQYVEVLGPNDCPPMRNLTSMVSSGIYKASEVLMIDGSILTGSNVTIQAGQTLNFLYPFQVQSGADLLAKIAGCDQ